LEALEKDNFQDDIKTKIIVSEYRLNLNKKLQQKFSIASDDNKNDKISNDSMNHQQIGSLSTSASTLWGENSRKKLKPEAKLRFRKNFTTLIEEEVKKQMKLSF
jgi:hypothetical protein